MARYQMEDGTVVDTDRAAQLWRETTRHDGQNHISVPTGSQWHHQTLYRSRRGRYYLEHWSAWQGSTPHVEWVSPQRAVQWLLLCGHEIPEDLAGLVDEVIE